MYGGASWPAYVMITKTLLRRRVKEPSFVCCDWQGKPKHQALALEDELCTLPYVAGCLRVTSEMSAFIQVTDLLLGVVAFDWREAHGEVATSTNAGLKRDMARFVKTKLGMAPSSHFLENGQVYRAKRRPLPFSVWQPDPGLLEIPRARGMHRGQSHSVG
ncbi:MAG: hypothetical protein QOF51_3716 [Chloroflexota bacterium]|nr:hypothetical protein [Chloroflexota bacterium]